MLHLEGNVMIAGSALLEALPVAVYMTDAEGRITFYNEAAAELWGHRPQVGTDKWCGSWRLFWPDGRPLPHDECPMAVTLRRGEPVRGVEALAERPDGTRVRFLPYPTPVRDEKGRLTGAINLLMDITERYEAGLRAAHLAAIVSSSDDAIASKTLDGIVTSWNAGATAIFGYEADEMIGQHITRIIPPELHGEEQDILAQLRRGERIHHYETVRLTKDGRRVDVSLTVSPVRDQSGKIIGASKIGRDISERRRAEKLQRLLVDELNHRVKNTLATVQAIATQSSRHSRSPADFVRGFSGRVQALSRAHDLLTQTKLRGADATELVRGQVLLDGTDDRRIAASGPVIMLDVQSTMHLALVLHELATNARKHGALSVPNGRLSVSWQVRTNGGRNLLLEWKETGGPRVRAPKRRGFGTTLIERTLETHGGEASVVYDSQGMTANIGLPLPQEEKEAIARRKHVPADVSEPLVPDNPSRTKLDGKRVIVIEDEPLLSMDLESSLMDIGCEVSGSAGTIEEGRLLVARTSCDAALLDVNLAGHPVDELAAALTRKNIPFAFVTGYGRSALPAGFRDALVLGKPFSDDQLRTVLERLLHPAAGVVQLRQSG
jgi:PAS domain S-box-containing protein